jgi:hypothetical protein
MRVYLDLNCFNRPFDDQTQERIRLESDAIFSILNRIIEGTDNLLWSTALAFENSRHPKLDRAVEISLWQQRAVITVLGSGKIEQRAREIHTVGIGSLDAIHLACAEAGLADVFLTCDDEVKTRAQRLELRVRVMNPLEYWKEVALHG